MTTTYVFRTPAAGKYYCWEVLLKMVEVIWIELGKVRVEVETTYGLYSLYVMVGNYLWETLQDNLLMDDFLWNQFWKHLEVYLHINIILFNYRAMCSEVVSMRQKV